MEDYVCGDHASSGDSQALNVAHSSGGGGENTCLQVHAISEAKWSWHWLQRKFCHHMFATQNSVLGDTGRVVVPLLHVTVANPESTVTFNRGCRLPKRPQIIVLG